MYHTDEGKYLYSFLIKGDIKVNNVDVDFSAVLPGLFWSGELRFCLRIRFCSAMRLRIPLSSSTSSV